VVSQWCYSGVTVVLQWCYNGGSGTVADVAAQIAALAMGTGVLQWCYSDFTVYTVVLKRSYSHVTVVLQWR
jgi:hypothetical protein